MKNGRAINHGAPKYLGVLLLVLPCFAVMNRPSVKVTTKIGRVVGTEETVGPEDGFSIENNERKRFFHSFRGIPYAKPPIGELRWKVCSNIRFLPSNLHNGVNFHFHDRIQSRSAYGQLIWMEQILEIPVLNLIELRVK